MRIAYPRSFLKLLLLGFALVILPLLIALGNAAMHVDQLAEKSRLTLAQATQSTRASHVLLEQIRLMERSARQYFVLQDSALFNNYLYAHRKFISTMTQLSALNKNRQQAELLQQIQSQEYALYKKINALPSAGIYANAALAEFIALSKQGERMLVENDKLIDHASMQLAKTAEDAQKIMLWQALALIPVAVGIAILIALLVARPIRRMDAAIRRLGEGQYAQKISIDGPGDLRSLGERLDWLRLQLDELAQQKQRFLRHISHELKTPLTAIREGSELLGDQVGGSLNHQQLEIAHIIRENGIRLQKMIENLLNFTAAQDQTLVLNKQPVDIVKLIETVVSQYSLSIENKGLKINRNFNVDSNQLMADTDKIRTIIDNLISNAVKHCSRDGTISISLSQQANTILLDFADSGAGIASADRPHIFAPFYKGIHQGDQANIAGYPVGGTGLGLSIAREYVEAHGGEISLLEPELGACFRVKLPIGVAK